MSSYKHTFKVNLIASLVSLGMSTAVYADDTEIYLGKAGTVADSPNVLFIIDTSGSMGNPPSTGGAKSKLDIVKEVFTDVINKTSGVNAAIMRFDNRTGTGADNMGGYFLSPMKPLNDANRGSFRTTVSSLTDGGFTPLSETLYESYLYWTGQAVKFGNSTRPGTNVSTVLRLDDPSTTLDESTLYASPILSQCQKNYTVLLTDGLPTFDSDADTEINTLIKTGTSTSTTGIAIDKSCGFKTAATTGSGRGSEAPDSDDCLNELSQYMYENDIIPDVTGKTETEGKQNVTTYTIGFDIDAPLLATTAKASRGTYFTADDGAKLADALSRILEEIGKKSESFTSPTLALNAYNGINHHDELYFAQFKPENSPKWAGNLKSYVLSYDPTATCVTTLKDADGNDALEPAAKCEDRYQIKETARSFWSSTADGTDVTKGGAAGKLGTSRNVVTYVGTDSPSFTSQVTLSAHKLNESNTELLDHSLFGIPAADAALDSSFAELKKLIAWARGIDVDDANGNGSTTDSRTSMGDPLHSQPVIVSYSTTDEKNASMVLYVATNEGFLHAIDVSIVDGSNAGAGTEKFAYIPKELLPNLKKFRDNTSTAPHPYGLDGAITAWVNDKNGNGTIETSEGDFVYLYVGMRRGGKNYYALNVTDPDNPKLMWEIKGGEGDFTELAQTWSRPTLANIMVSGTKTKVLVFAGGYDADQDNATTPTEDDTGRAIYVVNAETGQRLWWAGGGGSGASLTIDAMKYSIPSDVRVLDTDLDGLHDRMYVGDTHAQIFRIDIDDDGNFDGGQIAAFGGTDEANNRRFYYAPDVVLTRSAGRAPYLTINIGSGFRAHPLNPVILDRFYSFRDYAIFTKPASYTTLTETNLLDVTTDLVDTSAEYDTLFSTDTGWMLRLNWGEKVLSSSLTFNSSIFFTTFTPGINTDACSAGSAGIGKLYVVNLFDGNPIVNSPVATSAASVSDLTPDDRSANLKAPGIPPAPTVAFSPKKPVACVGTQCFPDALDIVVDKTYWEQAE